MKHLILFEAFSVNDKGELKGFFDDDDDDDYGDETPVQTSQYDVLNGKYRRADAEINTHMQTISIGHKFYLSGEEAMEVIRQIYDIWREDGGSKEDAVMLWYDYNAL
jgi:hypothetical protein